jgi:hypothetical protein
MKNIIFELEMIQKEIIKNQQNNVIVPVLMSKTDKEINEVMDILLSSKNTCNFKISIDVAWLLMGFGFNMATYSLWTAEQRYFNNGLTAIGIASQFIDLRDCLRLLSLYWDVFVKKGLSFKSVISQNSTFSVIVKKFLERKELDKSLECMGFILTGENDSVQYQIVNR